MVRSAPATTSSPRLTVAGGLVACALAVGAGSAVAMLSDPALGGTAENGPRLVEVAASVARALVYVGVLVAGGGVAFLLFVHDRRPADTGVLIGTVVAAALLGALASVATVPLHAAYLTGSPAAMADPAVLATMLGTNTGTATVVRLAGLALLLVGTARLWGRWASVACLAGALVALGSFTLAGHTVTTEPRWLVVTANYAHTLTGAVWLGGLVLLSVTLRRRRGDADASGPAGIVARFSTAAVICVVGVALAGLALAWAEVRSLSALTGTVYGWLLLGKVGLVAAVVVLGGYNNRRLVPAVERDATGGWDLLARTVRLEAVGLVAVLGVTGVLVNQIPARSFVPAEPVATSVALGDDYQVHLVVDPARAGVNEFHIYLFDDHGTLTDAPEDVRLAFRGPDDATPVELEPNAAGPGHYLHVGPQLDTTGTWTVELHAVTPEHGPLAVAVEVPVASGGGLLPDPGADHAEHLAP